MQNDYSKSNRHCEEDKVRRGNPFNDASPKILLTSQQADEVSPQNFPLLRNDRFGGVPRAGSSSEASFEVFASTRNKQTRLPRRLRLLAMTLLISILTLPASAVSYDQLRNFMLQGDVESVIKRVELKEDLPLKLNDDEAELYIQSLFVMGELDAADSKLDFYLKKYPKNESLKALKKDYLFYQGRFKEAEEYKLDNYEKTQYKLMEELDEYLVDLRLYKIKHPELIQKVFITNEELDSHLRSLRKKILKNANKLEANRPYFRPKLEYLLELKDPEINELIEKEALKTIKSKRTELFPKTMDFYELALAYKALAILSIQVNDNKSATSFIKLGQQNIYKMRSIWLIEDIIVEKRIMKTIDHISKFGYLIPQWIVSLREEFDSYLN